jgi:2-oxoglutarate dehydrogenase E1 component
VSDESTPKPQTQLANYNAEFIEQLYEKYRRDPSSVDSSWEPVFEEYFEDGEQPVNGRAPSFRRRSIFEPVQVRGEAPAEAPDEQGVPTGEIAGATIRPIDRPEGFAARVEALVQAYRLHGHLVADIDPLGRARPRSPDEFDPKRYGLQEPELDPAEYGITEEDLDSKVYCEGLFPEDREVTLREVIDRIETLYCGTIGVEYQNMPMTRSRTWLREQIEEHDYASLEGPEEKQSILRGLIDAKSFEQFLHQKYIGAKRFALTGGDSLIPMLDVLFDELGQHGVDDVVLAMAHRGRLNVLHNIMDKPAEAMFSEFEEDPEPTEYLGSSDVKYHMGYSSDYTTRHGDELHLSLCFNPSHLEYVNPTALGRARAKQKRRGLPEAREQICPLLLHGDAAFAGQGIAAESLNLARLKGFSVGGTIHVVINNQIGFTTEPESGRSTTYATDIAKMLEVPIFHVNVNDPEACARVMKLAARYRQHFNDDVIIDLVCYRQYGHNEGDEPRFTQPQMYEKIEDLDPTYELYTEQLVEQGHITRDEAESMWDEQWDNYSEVFDEIHGSPLSTDVDTMNGVWQPYEGGNVEELDHLDTTVERERLQELGHQLAEVPDDFTPHRTIGRLLDSREAMIEGDEPINWPFAEALATASLLTEGVPVRLSGQDSVRGTFSHRHAALFDVETGEEYWPARHLSDDQANYEVYNSMLSEAGVLGYEYGYSLDSPDSLVCWEAQFGDFANGAQVIIDQFVSSSEDKWKRLSGLVMLLPHAYEGQGPEHSSARLERFLQLCAEDNMFVGNLTEPAQYFHVLRRQMLTDVRKPLVLMTPKSLLRHKEATSSIEDFTDRSFRRIIPDDRDEVDTESVERVLLCSGKVYYDLLEYAREHDIDDVAIVRVEQLHPLDRDGLLDAVEQFPNYEEVVWVQEEPKNMGAWSHMMPELIDLFGADPMPEYVGRVPSASPATGSKASHKYEQKRLVENAFA